jgi:hypothetical protein
MTAQPFTDGQRRNLRLLAAVAGGLLIAMALAAGLLNMSEPGTFGIGRLLQIGIGSLLFLTGLLGRRITEYYQGAAIILLNTALLLGCLELASIAIARLGLVSSHADVTRARYFELPYYREQEWTESYWREAIVAEVYQYQAYTVWRHKPFAGSQVNISPEGIRDTPGAVCTDGAYTVYTFGGSSMWGWGSPDWGTIAAYLQSGLEPLIEGPVCVVNLGEDAYVSTQSLVTLILELQRGSVPDLVLFYDGVNDVYAAYESGQPGVHPMFDHVAGRFEQQENGLILWLKGTRLFWLAKELVRTFGDGTLLASEKLPANVSSANDFASVAESVADRYLGNYNIVNKLAAEYGFHYYFFWQPHLAVGDKALTRHEQEMRSEMDETLVRLASAVYRKIAIASLEYEELWYIAEVLDDHIVQIWIDAWGHITPEGNELVAHEMLSIMETHLTQE